MDFKKPKCTHAISSVEQYNYSFLSPGVLFFLISNYGFPIFLLDQVKTIFHFKQKNIKITALLIKVRISLCRALIIIKSSYLQ